MHEAGNYSCPQAHPVKENAHCPKDGCALHFDSEDRLRLVCADCDYEITFSYQGDLETYLR